MVDKRQKVADFIKDHKNTVKSETLSERQIKGRIRHVESKIAGLENELSNLYKRLSASQK